TCRAFATYVGGSEADIYIQSDAREALAYSSSTGQRVLMYACHGEFNPGVPLASRLLLAPSAQDSAQSTDRRLPDGNYHASEVLLTDHRGVDLVVLAACETLLPALRAIEGTLGMTLGPESDEQLNFEQLELIVAGDEVVGLARSFLSSGANSVLATLWQASPFAIEKLLVSFGEHAQAGMTWSQALRQAQRVLIANESFDDVWFWAPYQLIGRWR
ncbi:CHAT domain-containing protein, partial [Candidatus Bipolaricaulota bacterium]|nr:CHAT domain-containing protein [Candidatus Bipolaricaulota bacterium]